MEEKHNAVCCVCGKDCEVPFKPKNPKSVKCRDCYKNEQTPETEPKDTRERTKKILGDCIDDVLDLCQDSGMGNAEIQAFICTLFIQRCRVELK